MQDLTAQYEGQLAAAKAAASNAADSSETEKAAAIAARTAAAAAAEREALLKQSLHDVEERSAATSSQLGATQQRVSYLAPFCLHVGCINCVLHLIPVTVHKQMSFDRIEQLGIVMVSSMSCIGLCVPCTKSCLFIRMLGMIQPV